MTVTLVPPRPNTKGPGTLCGNIPSKYMQLLWRRFLRNVTGIFLSFAYCNVHMIINIVFIKCFIRLGKGLKSVRG